MLSSGQCTAEDLCFSLQVQIEMILYVLLYKCVTIKHFCINIIYSHT